jgi:hypothetical protein
MLQGVIYESSDPDARLQHAWRISDPNPFLMCVNDDLTAKSRERG